jgi:hypothetical protein
LLIPLAAGDGQIHDGRGEIRDADEIARGVCHEDFLLLEIVKLKKTAREDPGMLQRLAGLDVADKLLRQNFVYLTFRVEVLDANLDLGAGRRFVLRLELGRLAFLGADRFQASADDGRLGLDLDDRLVRLAPLFAQQQFEQPLAQANFAVHDHGTIFLVHPHVLFRLQPDEVFRDRKRFKGKLRLGGLASGFASVVSGFRGGVIRRVV